MVGFHTSAGAKKNVLIMGEGGTIMSRPTLDAKGRTVFLPQSVVVDMLIDTLGSEIRSKFNIEKEVINPFDSSEARADQHIQDIVNRARNHLLTDIDILIIAYGTDTTPAMAVALGNGVAREELGNKGLILTGSMHHFDEKKTDAIKHFGQAFQLASMDEIHGKAGLNFSDRFFPLRGIEKIQRNPDRPFVCRFFRQAKYHGGEWKFRSHEKFDDVIGRVGKDYRLAMGVHTTELTPFTDYSLLSQEIRERNATVLVALNFPTDDRLDQLRVAAQSAKGPVVVVSSIIQNAEERMAMSEDWNDAVYSGDPEMYQMLNRLIFAGLMTKTEATTRVSELICRVQTERDQSISSGEPYTEAYYRERIADLIKFDISHMPFSDFHSSQVTKRKGN